MGALEEIAIKYRDIGKDPNELVEELAEWVDEARAECTALYEALRKLVGVPHSALVAMDNYLWECACCLTIAPATNSFPHTDDCPVTEARAVLEALEGGV